MKYQKKPVVIEAFQWTGDHRQTEEPEWMCRALETGAAWMSNIGTPEVTLHIHTLEGIHAANVGDYIIKGVKGELYPCKPDIFEMTYRTAPGSDDALTFGHALEALKKGLKVARAGWNGQGMWLSMSGKLGGTYTSAANFWSKNNHDFALANGGGATVLPSITMKTVRDEIMMGWVPTQTDMLAEDWRIVE